MKKRHIFFLAAIAAVVAAALGSCSPAWAATEPDKALPAEAQYRAATAKLVTTYMAEQGWCSAARPEASHGRIVIYYVRDPDGSCAVAFQAATAGTPSKPAAVITRNATK